MATIEIGFEVHKEPANCRASVTVTHYNVLGDLLGPESPSEVSHAVTGINVDD